MAARTRKPGFSLIEILVSMALALVLILGTAELIVYSLRAKKKGDLASGLARAATSRLDALRSLPFDAAGLEPGRYSETVLDELSRETLRLDWTVEEEERMKRVFLATRSEDHPESELRLVLYISLDLGFGP